MNKGAIVVLLSQAEGKLHPISAQAAAAASELSYQSGRSAYGVLLTDEWTPSLERSLKGCGLSAVYVYKNTRFGSFIAEEHTRTLVRFVREIQPDIFLAGATPEGRALTSMVAAKLKTGVTADCTALSFGADGLLVQTRPAFGGSLMAKIVTPAARPQIATLRYGIAKRTSAVQTSILFKQDADGDAKDSGITAEWLDRVSADHERDRVILALGGGLTSKEDIALFRRFAEKTGASLMCSRALVERGWFLRSCQIGLSGQYAKAALLITFGISGSVQFMAGAEGVQKLCAINLDENAPIMKAADVPIVGDMVAIANAMIRTAGS